MAKRWLVVSLLAVTGCGGGSSASVPSSAGAQSGSGGSADPAAQYAPLDVGAEYASWTKLNTKPFVSETHGNRFVDVYVNDLALEAYKSEDQPFPVGSILVKTSWEADGGQMTEVDGPIFIMEKKPAGFDPDNADWWFGLHWENVPAKWQRAMKGGQAYWRTPSKRVNYCVECHQVYDRWIGGIPGEFQAWGAEGS